MLIHIDFYNTRVGGKLKRKKETKNGVARSTMYLGKNMSGVMQK